MAKRHRLSYDQIALVPSIVADIVVYRPYEMQEFSQNMRSQSIIEEIEGKRKQLTIAQCEEFIQLCDKRCRDAYEIKADWFEDCVNSDSSDQLMIWITHWLVSYINNPKLFRRKINELETLISVETNKLKCKYPVQSEIKKLLATGHNDHSNGEFRQ